jgi:hypothetical protein
VAATNISQEQEDASNYVHGYHLAFANQDRTPVSRATPALRAGLAAIVYRPLRSPSRLAGTNVSAVPGLGAFLMGPLAK